MYHIVFGIHVATFRFADFSIMAQVSCMCVLSQALAVTVTKFAVEPLEHIGVAVRKFILAMLYDVPYTLYPFLLVFAMLLVLMVLLLSFGYRIKLFYLLGLEPAAPPRVQVDPDTRQAVEDIRQQVRGVG